MFRARRYSALGKITFENREEKQLGKRNANHCPYTDIESESPKKKPLQVKAKARKPRNSS